MTHHTPNLSLYRLEDRYAQTNGRVYLTGTQALVRIMLDQAARDRAAGRSTAGFVSGYRGSPLGGVDLEMWRSADALEQAGIDFMPAAHEDLGATAVLGAQQATLDPACRVEGVFSMWYGRGPGVDRSGDAMRCATATPMAATPRAAFWSSQATIMAVFPRRCRINRTWPSCRGSCPH